MTKAEAEAELKMKQLAVRDALGLGTGEENELVEAAVRSVRITDRKQFVLLTPGAPGGTVPIDEIGTWLAATAHERRVEKNPATFASLGERLNAPSGRPSNPPSRRTK